MAKGLLKSRGRVLWVKGRGRSQSLLRILRTCFKEPSTRHTFALQPPYVPTKNVGMEFLSQGARAQFEGHRYLWFATFVSEAPFVIIIKGTSRKPKHDIGN